MTPFMVWYPKNAGLIEPEQKKKNKKKIKKKLLDLIKLLLSPKVFWVLVLLTVDVYVSFHARKK